jgi:hypothetical protein
MVCEGAEQRPPMRTHTCCASLEEAQTDGALTLNHGKFLAVWFNFAVTTVFLLIAFKLADRVKRKAERIKQKTLVEADDAVGDIWSAPDGFGVQCASVPATRRALIKSSLSTRRSVATATSRRSMMPRSIWACRWI